MKLVLPLLLWSAASLAAAPTTWNLDKPADLAAWKTFGTVAGHVMGPSAGDYAVSGFASGKPVVKGSGGEVTVKITEFTVSQPAPDDAENGNDLRLNVLLSPKPEYLYENDKKVLVVVLSYNSANRGVYASVQFKDAAKPNASGAELAGGYVGDDLSALDVVVKWKAGALTVDIQKGGSTLKSLAVAGSPALAEMLKGDLYLLVYQQNIRQGQGTVSVGEITTASNP